MQLDTNKGMDVTGSIIIEDRYCGPVGMGNGGYICGLLAGFMDGPLSVSLRAPPRWIPASTFS